MCAILDQAVLLALFQQSLAGNSEHIRRLSNFVVRRFQRYLDGLAFQIFKRAQHACKPVFAPSRPHNFRKIFGRQ